MNIKYGMIALYMASSGFSYSQNIGINATGIAPDGSATLDVNSTAGGMLIPRMTTIQRDAINGGTFANALLLFNTTDNCLQIRNTTSNQWENVYCFSNCNSAPLTPVANAATGFGTSILVTWSSVSGAASYAIDVDDNSDFSSPLVGYNNLNVGNTNSFLINGITCGTDYHYRVRASNACGISNNSNEITINTECVVTSACGRTWMDRNLGATQVATAFNDAASYGDLCQWGRAGDGHQLRTSGNQTTLATTPVPSLGNVWDGLFIVVAAVSPWNWLATPSDNLWQGVNGTNNPCPTGMRIPTQAEWECERADFINTGGNNRTGAFGSALALPSGVS